MAHSISGIFTVSRVSHPVKVGNSEVLRTPVVVTRIREEAEEKLGLCIDSWTKRLKTVSENLMVGDAVFVTGFINKAIVTTSTVGEAIPLLYVKASAITRLPAGTETYLQATITGVMAADAEHKMTPSGIDITKGRLAVKDDKDAETLWFNVDAWRNLANIFEYLKKGNPGFATGQLWARTYSDHSGNPRLSLDLTADEIRFVFGVKGSKSESAAPAASQDPTPREEEDDLPF